MKKTSLLIVALFAILVTILAQITQEESNRSVLNRMNREKLPYIVYAKGDVQEEGMTITTFNGEVLELDYPCRVYYVSYTGKTGYTPGRYLIVNNGNGSLLEVNPKRNSEPDNLAEWKVFAKEPCNCIVDTLKGEWSLIKQGGGFGGGTWDNEFKSIVRILSQNEDESINYEVIVGDTLFYYEGNFQIQYGYFSGFEIRVNIKLPYKIWEDINHYSFRDRWFLSFQGRSDASDTSNENLLIFWEGAMDGYYYYQRIK